MSRTVSIDDISSTPVWPVDPRGGDHIALIVLPGVVAVAALCEHGRTRRMLTVPHELAANIRKVIELTTHLLLVVPADVTAAFRQFESWRCTVCPLSDRGTVTLPADAHIDAFLPSPFLTLALYAYANPLAAT